MARVTADRSVVGGTSKLHVPLNDTRPTCSLVGIVLTNRAAATLAESMRVGDTSVACIDNDTSSARMIVARSLGTFSFASGCATATRPSDRDAAAEARGYERGYRQAVKEQYWIIQNQQRGTSAPAATENLNPRQP